MKVEGILLLLQALKLQYEQKKIESPKLRAKRSRKRTVIRYMAR